MTDLAPFAEATVRTTTPLLLAAMGETLAERSGVINVGMEGCIVAGAFAAFIGSANPALGYAAAVVAGIAAGALLVVLSVIQRRDQIIVGTAITLLAFGITGTLFRAHAEAPALIASTHDVLVVPGLSLIPVVGRALFAQSAVTYVAFASIPLVWYFLERTHLGLALRAVGDSPEAARAAGVRVRHVQAGAVLAGSALGGLAGGALVLAQAGSFAEGMSAGRGFLAIAIVALGRWRPLAVAGASILFGAAMALQFVVQALGWHVRYELVLMIPYLLTLFALGSFGRGSAPTMLGRAIEG